MSDIRLREVPFELDGRHYTLRCNMNVLADVQEAYNGDLTPALNMRGTLRSVLEFLAAMLNEDADQRGLFEPGVSPEGYPCAPELSRRFTAKQLGRKLKRSDIPMSKIFALVQAEIAPKRDDAQEAAPEGN